MPSTSSPGRSNSLPVSFDVQVQTIPPASQSSKIPGTASPSPPLDIPPSPQQQSHHAQDALSQASSPPPSDGVKAGPYYILRAGKWFLHHKFAGFITIVALVVGIIALVPSFRSQMLSEEALELSRWTAYKDYVQLCKESMQAGTATPECEEVSHAPLPPPPQLHEHSFGHYERLRRRFSQPLYNLWNATSIYPVMPGSVKKPNFGPSAAVMLAGAGAYLLIVYKFIQLMIRLRRLKRADHCPKCSKTHADHVPAIIEVDLSLGHNEAGVRTGYSHRFIPTQNIRRSYLPEPA